ncbi:MAG: AMP-binding protein [Leptolyngbya sp. SIO4C1]|nr:AMP-binding protein [Leptolyngbya sp. SIO4C1]
MKRNSSYLSSAALRLPAPAAVHILLASLSRPIAQFTFLVLLEGSLMTHSVSSPAAGWFPTRAEIEQTHIAALQQQLGLESYAALHRWSVTHRAEFWQLLIERLGIVLQQPYQTLLDCSDGVEQARWLVGARLNIAASCFLAPDDAIAVLYQPTSDAALERWRYGDLDQLSNRVANGLAAQGYRAGDAIAIVMPMTPTAVAIYLGIVKLGGVVVSIAESFAPSEIATRLQIAQTKAVFTQTELLRQGKRLPLYSQVIAAKAPRAIVLPVGTQRVLRSGDLAWHRFLSANSQFQAVPRHPDDATNILFSSGTTGPPKAIPWSQTTPIKCAADGYLHHDIHPADVVAWPTSLGWMMGPWLIYASLINRATMALYGDTPSDRSFGKFVQTAGVTLLGVVPSLVRTWRLNCCMSGLSWRKIRAFSSTGECASPEDMAFLMALAGHKPVIEYCGGTEIGGGYITGTLVQPAYPATFSTPALGLDLVLLDASGQPSDSGEAFIVPPSMGLSTRLLNRDHHQVYYANLPAYSVPLRRHGDWFERLPNGYYRAQGRVDDTMNLSGIKVSAAEIERVLQPLPGVRAVAAIAVDPPAGGPSQLVVYAVLTPSAQLSPSALRSLFQQSIRQSLNPLFNLSEVVIVESLPRTASNKVMRRQLRVDYLKAAELSPSKQNS